MFIKGIISYFQEKPKLIPVEKKQWVSVDMNNDFINVKTLSGYTSCAIDTEGSNDFLSPYINNIELGDIIITALSKSRMIDPKDFGAFFDREKLDKEYKEWIAYCQKTYKYKTKKEMFKNMKHCSLYCVEDQLTIISWHQEKPGAFGPTKNKDADNVVIPADNSPEDIGKAVRLALSRCTSAKF